MYFTRSQIKFMSLYGACAKPDSIQVHDDGSATATYSGESSVDVRLPSLWALLDVLGGGVTVAICKYADPTEGFRDDLTLDEARDVARVDSSLLYLD